MIPATHNEIEQIYLAVEANASRSICVTACHSGDGVTSIATALTERLLLAGYATLLVDLNLFKSGFEAISFDQVNTESEVHWLQPINTHRLFTGVALPQHPSVIVNYRSPQFLTQQIHSWLQEFDRVVIDTSPLLQVNRGNIPAQSVSSACEHTLMVVLGGKTTESQLEQAHELLLRNHSNNIGMVLNNMRQATLGEEMVRELNRFKLLPARLRNALSQQILKNQWLSTIA
ncbi:chromosome partitioning protein ParA [Vibrio sp. 404]|uniref:Chromosome partitioning protein ParA n=1 Tax=Vibrio marinisediminis TaxID=2758441 RepID=A0A7W2IUG1_9VIBR|nr:chromosome partitioning protein ParA [Vibrio marinisediminis]MBA5763540.1 chromosome partitioning protein ParA [Vibrio marinisediminis]